MMPHSRRKLLSSNLSASFGRNSKKSNMPFLHVTLFMVMAHPALLLGHIDQSIFAKLYNQ